jgi:hypothetical protein
MTKCYSITCKALGPEPFYVFAKKKSRTTYAAWLSAREAGFNIEFGDLRCVRESSFDDLVSDSQICEGKCYTFEFIRSVKNRVSPGYVFIG